MSKPIIISVTCKYSSQPVHLSSMARVLVVSHWISRKLQKARAISVDSDQTVRMHRLI